jgi:hypothetical protein
MKEMHDVVNCGLALKHDSPMWRDNAIEVVNYENSAGF